MEFDYKKRMMHVYVITGVLIVALIVFVSCYISIFVKANSLISELGASHYLLEVVDVRNMFIGGNSLGGEVLTNSYYDSYFNFVDESGKSVITYLNCQTYFSFNAHVQTLVNFAYTFSLIGLIVGLCGLFYSFLTNCYKLYIVVATLACGYVFFNLKSLNQVSYLMSLLVMLVAIAYSIYQCVYILKQNDSKKNKNIIVVIKA